MQNPFTTTFSKIPSQSYIQTDEVVEIIENFSFDYPSESVYKITGVRGSGKTVLLAKIEKELATLENSNWLIYRLSPARDMLQQLGAYLYNESFIKHHKWPKSLNLSVSIAETGGGIGFTKQSSELSDIGAKIEQMISVAGQKRYKILISIDEVSKTSDMIVFASEFGKWLRAGYPIYMVCTGLYENVEQLSNVNNLTFFRRATTIKTQPLNFIRMTEMYKSKLQLDSTAAKEMAEITKGYPFAFQTLGVLMFKSNAHKLTKSITDQLKTELFSYSYEKIWEKLSEGDRSLIRLCDSDKDIKRSDLISRMDKPLNYSTYRDRLLRKGLISVRQGYLSLALPFFHEYVAEYGFME